MRKILTYIVAAATILFPVAGYSASENYPGTGIVPNTLGEATGGLAKKASGDDAGEINRNTGVLNQHAEVINKTARQTELVSRAVDDLDKRTTTLESGFEDVKSTADDAAEVADAASKKVETFADSIKTNKELSEKNEADLKETNLALSKETKDRDLAIKATNDHWQVVTDKETAERILGDERTLQESKAYTDSKFGELRDMVEKNKKETFAGVAAALAASQVPQVTQGSAFSIGAGAGTYQGQSAIAIGMSFRFADDIITKITVTGDTQQRVGVGAGYAVEW